MNIKDMSLKIDKQSLIHLWYQLKKHFVNAPRWLFLRHSHTLDLIAVGLVLIVAVCMVVALLYIDPPGIEDVPNRTHELSMDLIDRLEFWIEEREAERADSLSALKESLF